ncbi:hypothetical protein [Hymenobacter mucosus]|uniref:Nuclease-related domain-containing protein n=1 Tax=Hymenobacter mucosus TaxID=1411120 RepID=A0A238VAX5_9BACT|nr:hypothetical protein [Hymenobacter mucosus]SNR30823.1 hypothetical protein SAMN06269173_101312 [Hymenobacter mucosus]
MKFNITQDSTRLKELVSRFNSKTFIAEIIELITHIQAPRIPFHPFQGLDSPFRQLSFLAALNLSSDPSLEEAPRKISDDEWKEIVVQSIKVRAGYYDELLPKEDDDNEQFYSFYKTSMPVFNDYFDTGNLNFEEQEIERIQALFSPFEDTINEALGLTPKEFIEIYHEIDLQLFNNANLSLQLLKESETAKAFWDDMLVSKTSPRNWKYTGNDQSIIKLMNYFQDNSIKYTIHKSKLLDSFPKNKINSFLSILTIDRTLDEKYLYYTQPNKVLLKPIYNINNEDYLIIGKKQILHAIFRILHNTVDMSNKRESYFSFRGNWLQDKTEELLRRYFGKEARIYNEYKVDGKAHDILLLHKSLALIIENKAHQEVQFSGVPNTLNIYKQYFSRFKKSIQDGYDQCWRIKENFFFDDNFTINDLKNNPIASVKTKSYRDVFSVIITLDKFRGPQINTANLLKLNEDDDAYPLSISIDDFEVLLLTFKKLKITAVGRFIHFLRLREQLQGRLDSNDELEVWGSFIQTKRFKIPEDPKMHFQTNPFMTEIFDREYETGLGFKNEKHYKEKRQRKYLILNSVNNRIV